MATQPRNKKACDQSLVDRLCDSSRGKAIVLDSGCKRAFETGELLGLGPAWGCSPSVWRTYRRSTITRAVASVCPVPERKELKSELSCDQKPQCVARSRLEDSLLRLHVGNRSAPVSLHSSANPHTSPLVKPRPCKVSGLEPPEVSRSSTQ